MRLCKVCECGKILYYMRGEDCPDPCPECGRMTLGYDVFAEDDPKVEIKRRENLEKLGVKIQEPTAEEAPAQNVTPPSFQTPGGSAVHSGFQAPTGNAAPPSFQAPTGNVTPPSFQAPTGNAAPPSFQAPTGNVTPPPSFQAPTGNVTPPQSFQAPTGNAAPPSFQAPTGNSVPPSFQAPTGNAAPPSFQAPAGNVTLPSFQTPTGNVTPPSFQTPAGNPSGTESGASWKQMISAEKKAKTVYRLHSLQRGYYIDLPETECIVGRTEVGGEQLAHNNAVSRKHIKVQINKRQKGIIVTDISHYGTKINGIAIIKDKPVLLSVGGRITLYNEDLILETVEV